MKHHEANAAKIRSAYRTAANQPVLPGDWMARDDSWKTGPKNIPAQRHSPLLVALGTLEAQERGVIIETMVPPAFHFSLLLCSPDRGHPTALISRQSYMAQIPPQNIVHK